MDGDGADRVVDLQATLDEEHRFDDEHASDDADHHGRPGLDERARGGDRHQAGEHAVDHHPGIGLAAALPDPRHAGAGTEGRGERGVHGHEGEAGVGRRERRRGVEPEPAEQQDERTEHRHRDVVARQRTRLAVAVELADAGPEHDGAGEGGDATHGVHDAGAGEVDVAEAPLHALAERGEPAAAPGPRTEQRVVDGAAEQAPADERLPLPALGHAAGRDGGRRVHEGDHVQEEGHQAGGPALAGEGDRALPEEHPVATADQRAPRGREAEQRGAEATEHDRETDQEEGDEAEAEDGEVRRHHVGGVLGATEAGFDEREPGLHEDHQRGADDDPEDVDVDAERVGRRFRVEVTGLRVRDPGHAEDDCADDQTAD